MTALQHHRVPGEAFFGQIISLMDVGHAREERRDGVSGALEKLMAELLRGDVGLQQALREFERKYIAVALKETSGNRSVAARKLRIHRNTLNNKVKSLNL